ncbi:MAG: YidC/Oxa1 family insertase periplasmic-domain containing protein [Candidatus Chromulinivorax sp.]
MNIKEWIFPLVFAIVMTSVVQYFLDPRIEKIFSSSVQSGQELLAPKIEDINKPLNFEYSYIASDNNFSENQVIRTPLATYTFSNQGAVLQNFVFGWQLNQETIGTIDQNERHFFAVDFDQDTPWLYTMVEKTGDENSVQTIAYAADFDHGKITKIFTMYPDSYQVDLNVQINYNKHYAGKPLQLRLALPQPVMSPEINYAKTTAFVNDKNSLTFIDIAKADKQGKFWAIPTCFGYETRFLVHALIKNENQCIQRAYFNYQNLDRQEVVLETKPCKESCSYSMSFYIGPKSADALRKVDERLLKTLNFGWLSPISHTMLWFLQLLYEQLDNYGWAIILLTLLLKLLLLPFTWYGEKNMRQGAQMQEKLAYLQRKYKDDPVMLEQQRAELIKKYGVPGLAGCLPLLLTLPILIGLNTVLSNAIELYGAHFLWIKNLYAVDPYYILPILTGLAMLAAPMDKNPQQGLMRYATALMMATIACYLSAGLVLFIFINSLVAAIQTHIQKR